VNTSTQVNDNETINFIYNSTYIEEHAKPSNAIDLSTTENIRTFLHPLITSIDKKFLTQMEFNLLKKIMLLGSEFQETTNKFISKIGFPRLLMHINDTILYEKTKENNYQHYLNIENLPPPIKDLLHTINNVKVADIQDNCPKKIAACKILGNFSDKTKPIVFGNNKNTLFAATKRAVKMSPIPDEQVAHDFVNHSLKLIEEDIGEYLNHFGYSYQQWYEHLPAKKQKLIEPIFLYYNKPEIFNIKYSYQEQYRILDEAYEAICKAELQPEDGKPRMVCSIPQKYKYAMGPITWKLEEICSKYLRGYCGNKNLTQMQDLINNYRKQGFTKVVEGDGSAFDNTQDIYLKSIDRYIYQRIADKVYHIPKDEFIRISQAYYKKMNVKYQTKRKKLTTFITYYTLGSVFSGDCDTTLCNTIRMAMYNRYVNDKAGLVYGKDYVVFSKGDDFSVLYKPYVKDEIIDNLYYKYFLKNDKSLNPDNRQYGIGQICKFLDIGGLNSFKFCSLRSWYKNLNGDVYLTRDPAKLYTLGKYSIKYKKYNLQQQLQYHFDLMLSYLINYKGITIFHNMAAAHAKQLKSVYQQIITKRQLLPRVKTYLHQDSQEKLIRMHIEPEDIIFGNYIKFYDITPNENFYRIDDNYWDTIKRITQSHTIDDELTQEEQEFVNEQINNEFDSDFILKDNDIISQSEANKLIQDVFTLKIKLL
jgi:hypothetical protein